MAHGQHTRRNLLLLGLALYIVLLPGVRGLEPVPTTVEPSVTTAVSPVEETARTGDGAGTARRSGRVLVTKHDLTAKPRASSLKTVEENGIGAVVMAGFRLGEMPGCATQRLPGRYAEWTDDVVITKMMTVRWTYGNETCNSLSSCFGVADSSPIEPQLVPVHIQPGTTVRFVVDVSVDTNFTIRPYWVPEANFRTCDVRGGIPIITHPTAQQFIVQPEYLQMGANYFIVETDPIFRCEYGLRVNVTVKTEHCKGVGEPVRCWGRGRCVATPISSFFECNCCYGYTGSHCEDADACASSPCQNEATCVDVAGEPTGTKFTCACPRGSIGPRCAEKVENLCNIVPCENNSTCNGNRTHYQCECPPGYHGWHCEVNINECASNPCRHGVCIDKLNGFQCFCIPGHGGEFCEKEYDECQSNPCKSGGFCIDKEDGWECHCGRGYTGPDCATKIDLCAPSPCSNATDCVDYGNTFTCTCDPGFTGFHCEININECGSNPCQNGGRCYDEVAGYKCMCTPGHAGPHCEHTIQALLPNPPAGSMFRLSYHHSHLHKLSIIAAMLAGALLIALSVLAGCYCRLYGTYHLCPFRQFKYKRQAE